MASNMFVRTGLIVSGLAATLAASAAADTVINNTVVTNTSNATATFTVTNTFGPSNIVGPTFITGSVTGTVTDLTGDGATVGLAPNSSAIYSAFFNNGTELQKTLMNAPNFSFSAGQFLSNSTQPEQFFNLVAGNVTNNISITLTFTLTPGDSASFTSIFTVVPVPAPGACVALVGLVALGRRRRD